MKKNKLGWFIGLLAIFFGYVILSFPHYSGDIKNHLAWAQSLDSQGFMGFYERDFPGYAFPNYPPVAMTLFWLSWKLYQVKYALVWWLNTNVAFFPSQLVYFMQWENVVISFLKLPAILSALGVGVMIYKILEQMKVNLKMRLLSVAVFFFNPATIYLTSIWGQIDLLPLFFFLWSLLLLFEKKLGWSYFLAAVALLSKQTILIFWAVYLAVLFKQYGFKETIRCVVLTVVMFYAAYLPFHSFSFTWLFELYYKNFTLVAESTSENALNLWGFLYDFVRHDDRNKWMGISLQSWGFLMFAITAIPTGLYFYFRKITLEKVIEYLMLISFLDFFFLTRMHERYLIPGLVLLIIVAAVKRKRYFYLVLFFIVLHFLNLYRGLYQPDMPFFVQLGENIWFLKMLVVGYALALGYMVLMFLG